VIGHENVPERGGVIVAANHLSYLDPPVISVALKRQATYIAKEGLFRTPLFGKLIRNFSFPVSRDKPQSSTIKEAVTRLRDGEIVVVFPEGGRSTDGSLQGAKRGVGMIAVISKATVVPTLIEGTDNALPVGAKFLRPAKIRVIFGTQLKIEEKETERRLQERISREVMERIKNLKLKGHPSRAN
jgi:1-acyl-sn-glycerol-3-phosphate acyltransferase